MQPLTLPEQRELEQILLLLKRYETNQLDIGPHNKELWIKALTIALQTNDALRVAWSRDALPQSVQIP